MIEVLHLAALFPATVGLCCAVGDRTGRARSVVPAAAMLIAMIAMATGWPAVPPLVWAGALLTLGVGAAALQRMRTSGDRGHARYMQLHRALGLVLGAALIVVSAAAHEGAVGSTHAGHAAPGSALAVTLAGSAGYVVFTVWLVARSIRRRSPLVGAVEASAMGLMSTLMAIASLAG